MNWADAQPGHDPLDQRRIEPGLIRGLLERVGVLASGEQLLDVAIGELSLLGRLADVGKRMAALPEPRHDPGVTDRAV